jgi:hypothetical protein
VFDDPPGQGQESKHSDAQGSVQDQDLCRRLAEATTYQAFCERWLSLQCHMFRGVRSALLLLGAPDTGPFKPLKKGLDIDVMWLNIQSI